MVTATPLRPPELQTGLSATFRSSCLGMMVILLPSTLRILPCRLISSPSHTSTLSPGWKLCSRSFPGKLRDQDAAGGTARSGGAHAENPPCVPVLSVTTSKSMPSGWSSNFSSSDRVGFTPSVICHGQSRWPKHLLPSQNAPCSLPKCPPFSPKLPLLTRAAPMPHRQHHSSTIPSLLTPFPTRPPASASCHGKGSNLG